MSDALDQLLAATADDDTATSGAPKGGGLRKQLEDALAELKTLREEAAVRSKQDREQGLSALLAKHSIPAKAAKLFPSDGPLTDEAATAFVAEYGELWGATGAAETQPATVPAAEQAAANAMQQFASQAATPSIKPLSEDEYRAKFAEAKTKADLEQMLAGLVLNVPGV